MRVLVLGAGVIGTTTAWFLTRSGHEVTVVDREAQAASETSYANGGQISVSHAEPWANPSAPWKVLRWLPREDAPLLFRLRADPAMWRWALAFLNECRPSRTKRNIIEIVNLGLYSRATLQALRHETGIAYDHLEKGILHFYTDKRELDAARGPAEIMRAHGCELDMIGPDEVVRIEPALAHARPSIVGGSMTRADESGDARKFTLALAEMCRKAGVAFRYSTQVLGLDHDRGRLTGVRLRRADGGYETASADGYVLALGSYSAGMARPLGIDLLIYPAKGYSVTLPVRVPERATTTSLTDDEYKLVFSRLGERLRIAGTAELNGYNLELNPVRCRAILKRTLDLFPGVGDPAEAEFWTGLRPATPSNVPYIGRTRFPNLFLNTGHGTLGWTHSCGSARALADIVSGRKPEVAFSFTGL